VEYVVCTKCGTRIKAGRQWCLRCGDALPVAGAPVIVSMWESFELSDQKKLTVAAGTSLAVLALVAVIWSTAVPTANEVVLPAAGAPAARPAVTLAVAESSEPEPYSPAPAQPSFVPVTSMDSRRLGNAAYAAGNFAAARAAFEQALAQRPDDAETLNNLGLALSRLGQNAEAVARFERAVALAPEKSAYRFNLGHAMGELGQWERAVAEYREASRLFPTDYATQYNLAMALHKQGDAQAAIPEFQKAIALAPGEPSFHLSLGISLEQVGRVADAVREYRAYLEMDPAAPEAAKLKAHLAALAPSRAASSGPS
jgi:Flp pilus assembly protein TadD